MSLTVVVPFRNGHDTIAQTVSSVPENIRVIIVDDCSDTAPAVKRPNTFVAKMPRRGYFTGAVNTGIKLAGDDDVLVLNQDVQLKGTAWLELLAYGQATHGLIGERIAGNHPAWPNGYIHGTFMFIRRDVVNRIGYLNDVDYPLWGSTCEYQLRACRAGFKVLPCREVPGFTHDTRTNRRPFGESITAALQQEPDKKEWFIRTPPLLTIVVPCYNYGRYLADCLASLLGGTASLGKMQPQTLQSFEVIIVDDASTDDTREIAGALADSWKGVHYTRLAHNVGTASCINAGVAQAHGKYITVLSADDMREADSLERLYRTCVANPHKVAYDDVMLVRDGKRAQRWAMANYNFELLAKRNFMHAGIMFPKIAWEEVGGYPARMARGREDWAFNVALGLHNWFGVHVEAPGYLYRREGQNRSLNNGNSHPALGESANMESVGWRAYFKQQLMELFPNLYDEKGNVVMCGGVGGCGGSGGARSTPRSGAKAAYKVPELPGAKDGFELLQYLGPETGPMSFRGSVTGTRYEYSAGRVGFVDRRDVAGFLQLFKNRQQLFKVVVRPVAPEAKLAPKIEMTTVATVTNPPLAQPGAPTPEMVPAAQIETTTVTVAAVKKTAAKKKGKKTDASV